MPWKGEKDPYKIWLSEIILQQTRVEQGWNYYLRFIKKYPTVVQLANAPDEAVFKLWEGLGYYSRCRNLLAAARHIRDEHGGVFPSEYAPILALKGVGTYTAAAIASFAFGLPYAVVDGNVIRVLSRFFGISTPFDTTEGKKLFAALAQELLSPGNSSAYNQAIMDFGATVCKPASPLCTQCPLQQHCVAMAKNKVTELPVKQKQLIRKTRWFCYWIIENEKGELLVQQREGKDIWRHLHQFYLLENEKAFDWSDTEIAKESKKLFGKKLKPLVRSQLFTQQLTHQSIQARFVRMQAGSGITPPEGFSWIAQSQLSKLAFPKVINLYGQL